MTSDKRLRPPIAILAVVASLSAGCAARVAPPVSPSSQPVQQAAERKCEHGDRLVAGAFTYLNNQWGRDKVPAGETYEQCLVSRSAGDRTEYGWSFRWPGHEPSVYAYPEVLFGWSPWGGGLSSSLQFPMPVQGMADVTMTYEIESVVSGHYNLAFETWLMRTGGDGKSRPDDIAAEIMVWLDYDDTMRPSGSVVARVTIDGIEYDLYKDEAGQAGRSWTYLAYLGPPGQLSGRLRLDAFVADAVKRGYVFGGSYVTGVELGNECAGGSGTTWVKRLHLAFARPVE